MSTYSIKDLERISSQKAHTIRIWEQRYNLLEPNRSDTNIRSYNDDQLKKLLNVCTLMNKGMKISHISKLSKKEIAAEIDLIIADSFQGDVHIQAIINQALIAIATYDVALFDQLFSNALQRMGLKKTYMRILYPLLVRAGLMWTKDDLLPSQEHFLSNLIRQKLFTAIDSLPLAQEPDQTWILFLNAEENHEIGLLFAYHLLRQHGKKVIYLGAQVPYDDLFNVAKECKPTHLYTFFVRNSPISEVEKYLTKLGTDFSNTKICFSGGDDNLREVAVKKEMTFISTVESLTEMLINTNDSI